MRGDDNYLEFTKQQLDVIYEIYRVYKEYQRAHIDDQGKCNFDVPVDILISIAFVESSFNIFAFNGKSGAMGLFQLTPITLLQLSKNMGIYINPFDLKESVIGAIEYLEWLRKYFDNKYGFELLWDRILCAWNWGIGNTRKAIEKKTPFEDYPEETFHFVNKVYVHTQIYIKVILPP